MMFIVRFQKSFKIVLSNNSNKIVFNQYTDSSIFNDNDISSLFFVGQSISYSENSDNFKNYKRQYATIVEVSENTITLDKILNKEITLLQLNQLDKVDMLYITLQLNIQLVINPIFLFV